MRSAEIIERENDPPILLSRRKGSNPNRQKQPAVKCPICKKFLFSVHSAVARNITFVYDLNDEVFAALPRDYIMRCSRCHSMIGIAYLTSERRRELGLPSIRDCHGRTPVQI